MYCSQCMQRNGRFPVECIHELQPMKHIWGIYCCCSSMYGYYTSQSKFGLPSTENKQCQSHVLQYSDFLCGETLCCLRWRCSILLVHICWTTGRSLVPNGPFTSENLYVKQRQRQRQPQEQASAARLKQERCIHFGWKSCDHLSWNEANLCV